MMGYFKPLRRKLGVLTLVIACLFTLGWMRSGFRFDELTFSAFGIRFDAVSAKNLLCLSLNGGEWWRPLELISLPHIHPKDGDDCFEWWKGFVIQHQKAEKYGALYQIPYWTIVIPLTLLSAWLLVSKPEQSKPAMEPRV